MYTDKARPTQSYSTKARPIPGNAGRFGIGKFGQARFGISDGFTRKARPDISHSARADVAIMDLAQADNTGGYTLIQRPIA